MKSPDLILAALAVKGVFTIEEADEISKLYHRKATFDDPVPINLAGALDYVGPMLESIADDRGVNAILHRGHGPVVGECEDCGCPIDAEGNRIDDEGDGRLSDEEVEGALALWEGMTAAIKTVLK